MTLAVRGIADSVHSRSTGMSSAPSKGMHVQPCAILGAKSKL